MKRYYDIHLFYSRRDGYSLPFSTESEKELSEENVIQLAIDNKFIDTDDADYIDYVNEISEVEYKLIGGK